MAGIQADFWKTKSLHEMNHHEWEALCDGCGKCCLHKLEDEETARVFYTRMSCEFLDLETCRCSDYENRFSLVTACLALKKAKIVDFHWLPQTCAYRLLSENKPLPYWHYLVSGDLNSVHDQGISVRNFAISAAAVAEEEIEDQIIKWAL